MLCTNFFCYFCLVEVVARLSLLLSIEINPKKFKKRTLKASELLCCFLLRRNFSLLAIIF